MAKEYIWATGPLKLVTTPVYLAKDEPNHDQFTRFSSVMAQVHNSIIRALNGIYHLCPKVPESELHNFVNYAEAVVRAILWVCALCELLFKAVYRSFGFRTRYDANASKHHHEEESEVFPAIERITGVKGLMEGNVKQHEAFHDGLEAFGDYLKELLATDAKGLQTKRFRELFLAFAEPLQEHLDAEVTSILDLRAYSHTELDLPKLANDVAQRSTTSKVMVDTLPVHLLNHDRTYEDGIDPNLWPSDIPWVVSYGARKVGTWWYAGRWKFTSCTTEQMPRELPFMDLEDRIENS